MEALSSAQGGRWLEPSAVAAEGHSGAGAHYHHIPQTASVEVGKQRHACGRVGGWAHAGNRFRGRRAGVEACLVAFPLPAPPAFH